MATKKPDTGAPAPAETDTARKPWKKKTPTEVVLDQIRRLRDDVAQREEQLKDARRQLQKLEEVRKVLETN
jgi:hypothetical protein